MRRVRQTATQVERRSRAGETLARPAGAARCPTVSLIYGAALLGSFSSVNYHCVIPSGPKSVGVVNNRLDGVASFARRSPGQVDKLRLLAQLRTAICRKWRGEGTGMALEGTSERELVSGWERDAYEGVK